MEAAINRIAAAVRSNLQLPEDMTDTIVRYVGRAVARILVYCNRDDLPQPLEDVAAQIAEDILRADRLASTEQAVSSVSRGDTSIHFRDEANAVKATVDFIKDYQAQLIPYKKMRLPKDVRE